MYRCCSGRIIHANKKHVVATYENALSARISGTHAHCHTPRLNANINAAVVPIDSDKMLLSESSSASLHGELRSNIKMLRDISNVKIPTNAAPVATENKPSRHAGLPNGTRCRHTQPRNAHNG